MTTYRASLLSPTAPTALRYLPDALVGVGPTGVIGSAREATAHTRPHPDLRPGDSGFRCARVRGEPGQPAGKRDAPGAGAAPSGATGRQGDGSRSDGPGRSGGSTKTKRRK